MALVAVAACAVLPASAGAAEFTAAAYPVTLAGESERGVLTLFTSGGAVECDDQFHAGLGSASTTLAVAVNGTGCVAFGYVGSAVVNPEGCAYVLHAGGSAGPDEFDGSMSISCPPAKSVKVSVSNCAVQFPAQSGLESVRLINDTAATPDDLLVGLQAEGLKYEVTKDGFLCPFPETGVFMNGEVTTSAPIRLRGWSVGEPEGKTAVGVSP